MLQRQSFLRFLLLSALLLLQLLGSGHADQYDGAEVAEGRVEEADNGISEEPLVQCGVDSLSIEIRTNRPFSGRLFVKGFSQEQQCNLLGNGSSTKHQFAVYFGHCGLRRSREINGISVQATVVISFHPIFITKLDRAYRLNCFYTEARKAVTQELEVGQLTTSGAIEKHGPMPQCRYDILWLNARGQPIRFARIGDTVFHRWSCQSEQPDAYCMRVHSCTVSDGQGGQAVEVLDRHGCGVDALLLRDLDYTSDQMSAGQTASVFKFADKSSLHFNCQIELTLRDEVRGCELSKPKCAAISRPPLVANTTSTARSTGTAASPAVSPSATDYGHQQQSKEKSPPSSSSSTIRSSDSSTPSSTNSQAGQRTTTPSSRAATNQEPLVQETALPSAQFRIQPAGRSTVSGQQLEPFTSPPPSRAGGYGPRQTQVPPSKLVTESFTTEESGENGEEAVVGDWAQQDAIYQDETNTLRRRTPGPQRERRDEPERRVVRKVADFDLPERSLVVIELDENSLAHQPLLWRLLNTTLEHSGGFQCPGSLASQLPHWTILLVMLFLLILLSTLVWTNWPSRGAELSFVGQQLIGRQQQLRSRREAEERHFAREHLDAEGGGQGGGIQSLRF